MEGIWFDAIGFWEDGLRVQKWYRAYLYIGNFIHQSSINLRMLTLSNKPILMAVVKTEDPP